MSDLPLIGVTMGDPAGVGPEILIKALAERAIYDFCRPLILGHPEVLLDAMNRASHKMSFNMVASPSDVMAIPGTLDIMSICELEAKALQPGRPTVDGGRAMVEYIIRAVEMTKNGVLGAMVTCPINKALMQRAGYHYEGHTQLISHLTDTPNYVMMLAGKSLRVSLVTIHCALKEVPRILDMGMVLKTITITAEALRTDFGFEQPRLVVAALNPHAGEAGLFGTEEEEIIRPAISKARDKGYHVVGPLAPDTLFHKAVSGQFDAVVAMYHDQGLIPLKLLHFSDGVNVTLGLPIVRTSVDHGTAYDIAGTGQADASSLKAAIRMAATMVRNRKSRVEENHLHDD
ncbi:MAG: 4-hydroxythreonine-4-phosphate dehydrogenase PdxA [Thermodesulfobacteriota bacterium]|nr:4-hydroxythreonine-4-phosphate dehydrogenase PdxA [Thermodesulfobacteriota bacterium]